MKASNLSKIPPCPGSKFPESLIFKLLFSMDSTKSPMEPKRLTMAANINQSSKRKSVNNRLNNLPNKHPYHSSKSWLVVRKRCWVKKYHY